MQIATEAPFSQRPNHSPNNGARDPVSCIFNQPLPHGAIRRAIRRARIRSIRQRPIDNNCLCPIHISDMDQTAILRRRIPIPQQLAQIRAIVIIIASARAVLCTQTCHGEGLVLVRGLRGVGRVVETVGVVVIVFIGTVDP